jgi:hypothetical protein
LLHRQCLYHLLQQALVLLVHSLQQILVLMVLLLLD